jgi:Glyoxalase-like domain
MPMRHRDLQAPGVGVREPQSFSRPVTLANGTTHDARFRTTHLNREEARFGRLYFCQHFTRDLVWRPEWQCHPNGAQEIIGLLIGADNPDAVAAMLTRLFDDVPTRDAAGALCFTVGRGVVEIVSPATIAARLGEAMPDAAGRSAFMAQMRLKTTSLQQAREIIGTRAALRDRYLLVPAHAAGNVAIAFEA